MDVDFILKTLNAHGVRYMLIGGMNFALRHQPYATYDVDVWIEDSEANRAACETALATLDAQWGASDEDWGPAREKPAGWLTRQGIFSLHSPHGAIDVFRAVKGLDDWAASFSQSIPECSQAGTPYRGLSDDDMLRSQLALDVSQQKLDRIRVLQGSIQPIGGDP